MKRIIATIGLLCVGLSGAGHETNAQVTINIFNLNDVLRAKPIDETRFTVQYQTTSMPDTLQPDKKEEETLMLKVGNKCSVYYSYAKFLTDSVLEADKAAGASQEVINEHLQQYSSKTNAQVYKNYPAGKTTTLDALAASRFRCEEKEERPEWTLLPDTMTILSYPCRKATCHFKGRHYEAWYTPEIPKSVACPRTPKKGYGERAARVAACSAGSWKRSSLISSMCPEPGPCSFSCWYSYSAAQASMNSSERDATEPLVTI